MSRRTTDPRLRVTDSGLRTTNPRLRVSGSRLRATGPGRRDTRGQGLLSRLLFRQGRKSRGPARRRSKNRKRTTGEHPVHTGGRSWPKLPGLRLGGVFVGAILAVVGAVVAYRAVTRSSYFSVERYTFGPTSHVTPKELVAFAKLETGGNIFSVDLMDVARRVAAHPWIESARAVRRLPHTIHVEVRERRPAAAVLMDGLYLVDGKGVVFKRARYEEVENLAVITGVSRGDYEAHRARAERRLKTAIQVLDLYRKVVSGPAIGEVHVGPVGEVTLYGRTFGVQIRLGRSGFLARLRRLDTLLTALGKDAKRLKVVRLDNTARPDRITVRFGPAEEETPRAWPVPRPASHASGTVSERPVRADGRQLADKSM